ncbi:aminodeoxychorismate/anthranilate synthase component II [Lactococcus hircilactis]|uniref:Aminodeoxychorismate/anthranilate synthase component II n=1 Tax=Lactococcus hircilactis TaxID=1494462 RepID=A0A7X1Z754_9LACT|nr:aminodeoxychorismate/anthranilate synthase component II [Lactococcus hircilactis]MQW38883.1 aminodeoxychorismate/anthranilate synthase component II [Lactococcus hircilactis]
MILIIDNYDSFTYNLAQYLGSFVDLVVLRNDDKTLFDVAQKADALIFSPGPGWPIDAGKMEEMIREFAGKKPMLGICLGFQAMVEVFGGKLRLAHHVMHGKNSLVQQTSKNVLFDHLSNEFEVMRYHSIVMDEKQALPDFAITAVSMDDGEIMAIENEKLQLYGLQFHPESIGTRDGMTMIENFVKTVENKNGLTHR